MYHQRLKTPAQRFAEKFTRSEGCWIWNACLDSGGYGTFYFAERNRKAHAVSKAIYDGVPIDSNKLGSGLEWDHLCRNKRCVRPDHLELVTKRENNLRGMSPAANNARKGHCPNGHSLAGKNLLKMGPRHRSCRICAINRARKYNRAKSSGRPGPAAINAEKTHCFRGHEFTPENTRINGNGFRVCRSCERIRTANDPRKNHHKKAKS